MLSSKLSVKARLFSKLAIVAFMFVGLLVFSNNSFSQKPSGMISGIVEDQNGAVVPGAVVKAINLPKKGKELSAEDFRTASSNDEGRFEIASLEPGNYEVSVEWNGMVYKNDSVHVLPLKPTRLEIRLTYEANCPMLPGQKPLVVTDEDKAEIVNQILINTLVNANLPDHGLLVEQKGPIIVSTGNINARWIKPLPNTKFQFLSEAEIQDKANQDKDFLYLSFHDWKIGAECVVVTLVNSWAVGINSGMAYLSGGGKIYMFRKESGKWSWKSIGGWIS